MYSILVSDHARRRARERGMSHIEFRQAIHQARTWGDAVYAAPHGKLVVEHGVATTVLAPTMPLRDARLIERSVQ
jgi:hypothetical protein